MCFSVLWEARNIELFLLNLFQNKAPLVMENVTLRRDILRKIMSEKKKTPQSTKWKPCLMRAVSLNLSAPSATQLSLSRMSAEVRQTRVQI